MPTIVEALIGEGGVCSYKKAEREKKIERKRIGLQCESDREL